MLSTLLLSFAVWAQDVPPPSAEEEPASTEPLPLTTLPTLLEYIQAPYPPQAEEAGIEGTVKLLLEIDEYGEVTYVELLESAGNGFDEAAMDAAWQFLFSPAEDANGPTGVAIEFDYGFVLQAAPEQPDEPPPPLPVNLEGTLVEMGTRRVLSGIAVQVQTADGSVFAETTTDDDGRYQFNGVPLGTVTVRAFYPGYADAEQAVEITEGEVTDLRVWLKNLSYRDDEVVAVYRKESTDVTRRVLSVEEIRRIPGTFGDPVRVIQNLPGAARSPLGTGALIIRGANPEDSAVYVDGIRIPLIYHLGGYVSVLNADLIDQVNYLPGNYGVQYGRSTGGVVDVTTKSEYPEQTQLSWSTDLLDSGGLVQGRTGRNDQFGFAVAARRSYIDGVLASVPNLLPNPDLVVRPRWYDYQLKVTRLDDGNDQLSFFLFGFEDKLVFSSPDDFAQGTDTATQGDLGTSYSTHRAYVLWDKQLTEQWRFRFIPSIGVDHSRFSVGNSTDLRQTTPTVELRAEGIWQPSEALTVTNGLDFIGGGYTFSAVLPINPEQLDDYDPLGEREPFSIDGTGLAGGPDLYVRADLRPLTDRDRLLLSGGLRYNYVTLGDFSNPDPVFRGMAVEPRMMGRWWITEKTALKAGGGVYNQPPLPFEVWRPEGTVELLFERARTAELGVQRNIGEATQADATVFYKNLDRQIVANPDFTDLSSQFFTNDGIGRAYGLETIIRRAPVDRFFGWISYTLSRSERNDYPDLNGEEGWYLFDLDQTHILVGVAGYQFPRDIGLSGKLQYVSGNPTTPISGGVYDLDQDLYYGYQTASYNSERLPAFTALDLRIDKLYTFKRWQLELYMDVLNALRGENPEFVLYNYDYTESRYIRGLPLIPSPGFNAEFNF